MALQFIKSAMPAIPDRHITRSIRTAQHGQVLAILGPTNTGKTHFAIERMLARPTGIIGLPLRLLAREVYQRLVERAGTDAVALITGEEKIKPARARYWVSTVEAMPRDLIVSFVAIDEIQIAADYDRGHVFTDRLLNQRGLDETLLLGSGTMAPMIEALLPDVPIVTRPRLSKLTFTGSRKIIRLPRRSAIVAFSAEEVYAIAEWLRRQKGGAAVVLGALSPRTRNAQIALYQSGEVDYIVATDAIGMGLNLDVDMIAFASDRKFDGVQHRRLTAGEFGQIAGRAGRHLRDGSFCTTGRCPPFDEDLVAQLEEHRFDPLEILQWRNAQLDFSSLASLIASLEHRPDRSGLTRASLGIDQLVLDIVSRDPDVIRQAVVSADIARLWDVCQIPDYRKSSPSAHAELALTLYSFIVRRGRIPDDWIARRIAEADRTDGDIDTLSQRLAQVRTWSFIANRNDWLDDPGHWQGAARQVEDSLSDALHERLAQRFVDRRTSVLRRRLRENTMLEAEITSDGDVLVEGQHIGQLRGFRFTADPKAEGEAAKTLNVAGQKALAAEIGARATRVSDAVDTAFALSNDSAIRWLGEPVAKIVAGEKILTPRAVLIADEHLSGEALEKVQRRIDLWLAQHVTKLLGGLTLLEQGEGLEGLARGIAFRIAEELGVIERAQLAGDIKSLTQDGRASLRKLGVRFGAYNLYMPALLKPAPRALATQLWALKNGGPEGGSGLEEVAHLASSGRTSFGGNAEIPKDFYRVAGFRVSGERVVRVDILERLADLIRPAVAYRPGVTAGEPPAGTADGNGFVVTVAMTSLAGCSGEAFASILKSMGFTPEQRTGPAITVALVPKASTLPLGAKDEPSDPADAESAEGPSSATESAETTEIAAVEQDSPPRAGEVAKPQGTAAAAVSDEGIPQVPSVPDTPPAQREETSPVAADSENTLAGTAETVVGGEAHSATAAHDMTADAAPQNGGGEDRQHTSQAPAEARSDDQNIIAEGEAGSPAEPVLIEVWNPVRHQRPQRRPHFSRNGISSKPNATGENSGTDAGQPGRPGGGHQEGHRYEGRRQGGNAQRPRHTAGGTAGNETGAEKPRDGAKRFAGKSFSAGRTGSDKSKSDGRSDHGNRSFVSAENRPRDRAPDPLSPFAKLLALKAELEKNKK